MLQQPDAVPESSLPAGPRPFLDVHLSARSAPWLKRMAAVLWPQQRWQQAIAFVDRQQHLDGVAFADAALAYLQTRYLVDHVEAERIPAEGPAIVIANHPLGAIDALAMISLIGRVRRDFRFMANRELTLLEPLRAHMIPVDVLGGRGGAEVLRAAEAELASGRLLLVFPSGEVARWRRGRVVESAWQNGFARLAERSGAPVLPVHLKARNSALFYTLGALSGRLATAALVRETLTAPPRRIEIRIGSPLTHPAARASTPAAGWDRRGWVRWVRQSLLSLPRTLPEPGPAPIAQPTRCREWLRELRAAPCLLRFADGHEIRCCRVERGSALLDELGRLREISFRAAGEGSGLRRDIDRFDHHYDHLVLFDPSDLVISGAYRLGRCAALLAQPGCTRNLYTRTLFEWDQRVDAVLPQAVELGRSFVAPSCQGSRALDQLWCGIGAYLRQHPELRFLFGPVSLSATLPDLARQRLLAYYGHFYTCRDGRALARLPAAMPPAGEFAALDSSTAFVQLKEELRRLGVSVPTLYRQYTELTEPGGVRFLAFGTDPDFGGCVDGLLLLDLSQVKAAKRKRYLDPPSGAQTTI